MIDALGHYCVGDKVFTSKNLAYLESLRSNSKIKFYYNDDVFSKYDWTIEPESHVSVNEFYRRRAQQLRDTYDYIVLQYSGGPDSQNVLDTFINYGIKLDEIVNFNSYQSTQKVFGTTHNADYVYNVKPNIDNIIKNFGNTIKFSIIDEVEMSKKVWTDYNDQDYFELLFSSGTFPSVWMMRGIWVKHVKHIWDKILSGKKVCVILGTDKTNLRLHKPGEGELNKYFTNFNDILSCDVSTLTTNDKILNGHNIIELFYHTPSYPELTIKQAHVLKKVVERCDESSFEKFSNYEGTDYRTAFVCLSKKYKQSNLRYEIYHKTVYPFWKTNIITPKPMYFGNRSIDCWWVDSMEESEKKVWTNGIDKYKKSFGDFILTKDNNMTTLPISFTKPYYLEK
jgi:hypothetical protein